MSLMSASRIVSTHGANRIFYRVLWIVAEVLSCFGYRDFPDDPFLGICVGMQLLFDGSDEGGGQDGLSVLPGHCRRFPNDMVYLDGDVQRHLKVPHMGWNDVQPSGDHYYFVHSYYVDATDPADVMWTATYGDIKFAAAVNRDNIYGCQFHPEKSQQSGLRFLRAYLLGGRA